MTAKDLQIGDWVYDNMLKGYGKIEVLTPFAVQCDIHTDTHHMDFFQPIPLTEEILKANGFRTEEFEYGEVGWYPKEGCTYITQYPHKNPMFALEGTDIDLEYVHQLQQALRLCGLNDLADNFKLT